ncbi:MAG: divergent polysaccharide deacetylase family protein, partial [Paracoccaceae bacterium]
MAGGFIRGLLWGGVVSFGVAGTASVLSDRMNGTQQVAAAPKEIPAEAETPTAPVVETAPTISSEAVAPETPVIDDARAAMEIEVGSDAERASIPNPEKPDEEVREAAVSADTGPAPVPQVGNSASGLGDPAGQSNPETVDAQTDAQVQSARSSDALEQPNGETPLTVETASADPLPLPEPEVPEVAAAPQQEIEAPQLSEQDKTDPATPKPAAEPTPAPQVTTLLPDNGGEAGTNAAKPEKVATLAPKVQTKRLPTVQTTQPPAEADVQEEAATIVFDSELKPIQRFAVPFENTDAKPLMAIVLMDDGTGLSSGNAAAAALSNFPYPITFAVDSGLPDGAEKMRRYRDNGFEVMAMVNLPKGSSATDTEVSMGVALNAIPEAVAVLEGTDTGVQGNREMSNQIAAILSASGLGLVTQPKGLNTAQKLASRSGVPAATLFRDFDGEGQNPDVIRRFLDQAAFKAGQDGGVIMVGRLRPDTISAL